MSNYDETSYQKRIKDVNESRGTYQSKESDIPGNSLIYILTDAGLCILLFIFIMVGFFSIAKPPQARLASVVVSNLMYNNNTSSSLPLYFNATLSMEIRIDNKNRGFFEFSASKGYILYYGNGDVVGEMGINGQRVASFGDIRTNVTTEVNYRGGQKSPVWLKRDVERGLIVLVVRAKLRGEVHLKAVNKRTVNLKCLLHLSLKDKAIRRFWCK